MNKVCKWCHQTKPIDSFSRHSEMTDGYLHQCKSCRNEWTKKHRQKPEVKLRRKLEKQNPEVKKRYKKTEKGRIANARYKPPKEKMAAKNAINYALRTGKIAKQPCFLCGNKAQAHHSSYAPDMRLDVTWLCQDHHNKIHIEHENKKSWVNT